MFIAVYRKATAREGDFIIIGPLLNLFSIFIAVLKAIAKGSTKRNN